MIFVWNRHELFARKSSYDVYSWRSIFGLFIRLARFVRLTQRVYVFLRSKPAKNQRERLSTSQKKKYKKYQHISREFTPMINHGRVEKYSEYFNFIDCVCFLCSQLSVFLFLVDIFWCCREVARKFQKYLPC